jgi:thiamine pyrophosphokinase
MTILVFANGDLDSSAWLQPYLAAATRVIAADGGSRHLHHLQHPPDVVIGDLDSLPPEVRTWLTTTNAHIISHPAEKNETDLELALLYAVRYEETILVAAALGGRLDQTLANILLLAHPALATSRVELIAPYQRAWLITAESDINGRTGDTLSLIPLGGDVYIESTDGLKWPLRDEILTFGPARGVSNVLTADTARVRLRYGRLLCIHTQQAWQR